MQKKKKKGLTNKCGADPRLLGSLLNKVLINCRVCALGMSFSS